MAECIITGCELLDKHGGRQVHGDLWQSGDCFIFNACLDLKGETAWVYIPWAEEGRKVVTIDWAVNYFERRGVIVFEKLHSTLNQVARDYINKDPHASPR